MATEGEFPKSAGDVIYASEVNTFPNARIISQLAYEQVKAGSASWTNTDYLGADIFTDSNGAKNTIDTGNSTAQYNTDDYYESLLDETTFNITCDFTSVGLPSGWTLDTTSSAGTAQAATWDAANDEADLSANANGDPGACSAYLRYDTNQTFGIFKIGFRNLSRSAQTSDTGPVHASLIIGDDYIRYEASPSYSRIVDSEGGSTDLAISAIFWFKITKYLNGAIKTEYSTTGDSSYTTLSDESSGADLSGDKPMAQLYANDGSGGNNESNIQGSVYNFSIGTDYDTTEVNVETNTIIDDIVPNLIIVYGKTDLPTNTSITVDASATGGSPFTITSQEFNSVIDTSSFTGSSLALNFNLSTTSGNTTPKLYGYGLAIIQ